MKNNNQNRRDFVRQLAMGSFGGTILSSGAVSLFSSVAQASESAGHGHTGSKSKAVKASLAQALAECIQAGEACVGHCAGELAQGNKSMAKCNQSVHEMLAFTKALLTVASMGSAMTPKLAKLCADACKACADACAEHKEHFSHGMHLECKACMEACNKCEKECRAVA